MGRDWYWSGKSSSTSAAKKDKDKDDVTGETPGCMSGVLHLFDFHQFQFPMTQPPRFKPSGLRQQDPTSIKGVNAPRNSLESNEGVNRDASEAKREDFDFDISVELRKEAGHVKTRIDDQLSCSDSSNSPGPKTPSLVARLMGLDILPDSVSSSSSPSSVRLSKVQQLQNMNKTKKQKMNFGENEMRFENTGSRSLPDTPRISSARRSDVDPRHSLQIYRENVPSSGELDYSGRISKEKSRKRELRNEEENRSPSHYARQIVKQVKESVSRRVGLDITNTITTTTTPTNALPNSKDVDVVILKSKKPKRLTKIGEESNSNKHSSSSNSPRLRLCVQEPPPPPPPPRPILTEKIINSTNAKKSKLHQVPQQEKCKKASCERFAQRREAQASKSKTRTGPTSTSTSSSCNDDQVLKPGSRLSSSPSQITCATPALHARDNFADEIRYVSEILKCTGIHKDTLVSHTRWYSPAHPLDPALFTYLENFASPVPRWNRRLMFDLVDEILAPVIKPYLNMKPWDRDESRSRKEMRGEQLLQHLCYEISSFPSSNCQTLEDIDELVGKDLPGPGRLCVEWVAFEVERDVLDTLVHEMAAEVVQPPRDWCCMSDTI